jgi:hypothetical protein
MVMDSCLGMEYTLPRTMYKPHTEKDKSQYKDQLMLELWRQDPNQGSSFTCSSLTQCPLFPPFFSSNCTSPITIPLSTAFNISYTVNAAPTVAVIASISTPVRPAQLTVATTRIAPYLILVPELACEPGREPGPGRGAGSTSVTSTSTPVIPILGWQSGIRSGVFLAAIIPAMRATLNTSPFLVRPLRRSSCGRALEK